MLEAAVDALAVVLDPSRMAWMFLGIGVGAIVGLIPGLGGTVGMSILLPFVFGMDPFSGIAMLIGMGAVIHTADTFPAVLLGVPGSSGSQATIMDGYPLARQGQAGRALGAAFFCSMLGGVIGAIVLFAILPVARPLVLSLGSPELFMLSVLGLSMVGVLSRGSATAGVLSGVIGMALGMVGFAATVATPRFTFDAIYLLDGIPLAVLALGLFAIPELIDLVVADESISESAEVHGGYMQGIKDAIRNRWLLLRSAVAGTAIGMVPGLGGSVVDWITYGFGVQTSKNNENFGKGDIRGVIAPESANNGKEGGSLVPTLLFGIPGSGGTAVLLGGLALMGLQAGPTMITTDLPITLSIVWTLALANVFGAAILLLLSGYVARLTTVPARKLMPFLLVIFVVASYQSTRSWGDIIALLAIGGLGWAMKQIGWPRAPMLIGFVLAPTTERYLHISIQRYGVEWATRPGVLVIGLLTIGALGLALRKSKGRPDERASEKVSDAVSN